MKLPFNWFDLLLLIVLIVGLQRGRKHGMSEELMMVLKWLSLAVGCAFLYRPIGNVIADGSPVFNKLNGYRIAYVGVALIIAAIFGLLRKFSGGKPVSSEIFGRSEFYLGMMAGIVRFSCMLIMALALLNARNYTKSEIRADIKYQNDVYGSTFFPKLYDIQAQVFKHSLTGPWINDNLGFLLIKPTYDNKKDLRPKDFRM